MKATRILLDRVFQHMYTLFLKCFQRILNVLLDKEMLKYVHRNAEFDFLHNACIFAIYLNNFIKIRSLKVQLNEGHIRLFSPNFH